MGKTGIRTRTEAACERGACWASSVVSRIRPRASLASGSVLILVTLFLPITVDSCGNATGPGYNLALGRPNNYWPGFLGFIFESAGRVQYLGSLALAALTVLVVLGLFLSIGLAGKRRIFAGFFAVAGTLSLFTLADYFILVLPSWDIFEGVLVGIRPLMSVIIYLLLIVAILAPGLFWPKRIFAVWLIAFPVALLALWISERAAQLVGWELKVPESWLALPMGVYYLMPLFLWYWKGLLRRSEAAEQWPRIRLGLACLYTPAAAANCLLLIYASLERVWGLVPYVLGMHLISLGYMRLVEQGDASPVERSASPWPADAPAWGGSSVVRDG
jgi:hypothetical protein